MKKQLGPNSRVLIVEDQVIIAMDAETLLSKNGVGIIDSALSNEEALECITVARPDAAVLDLSLGATTSLPVARVLLELGVPFAFATGFDDYSLIPRDMIHAPIVSKPYSGEELISALQTAIANAHDSAANGQCSSHSEPG